MQPAAADVPATRQPLLLMASDLAWCHAHLLPQIGLFLERLLLLLRCPNQPAPNQGGQAAATLALNQEDPAAATLAIFQREEAVNRISGHHRLCLHFQDTSHFKGLLFPAAPH